jgi:HK97 family phage major capsid protein
VSKVFMLFGDATYQYLGVRGQIRFDTSIDAAFTTDEILIRAIERFTIGLMATGAVAGLQTAAS